MPKNNRAYKDSLFTDLFYTDETAKENLLSLFNALYGTSYTDVQLIERVRLEDVLFKDFKNDIAFTVAARRIILGEQQSTVNKNMPLRFLLYIAREYEQIISVRDRYRSRCIPIPTPGFITFYNGKTKQPEEQILKLSDAFMDRNFHLQPLELNVRVININSDAKHKILDECRILREYSLFVEEARKYGKNNLRKAVEDCISQGILEEYLSRRGSEVVNMLMAQYDYEMDIEVNREEAREEALEEGIAKGMEKGMEKGCNNSIDAMADLMQGKSPEVVKETYGLAQEKIDRMLKLLRMKKAE